MGIPTDMLIIASVSVVAALLSEGVSWFMVYRKPEYKEKRARAERLQGSLAAKKAKSVPPSKRKAHDRVVRAIEDELGEITRSLASKKLVPTLIMAVVFIGVYRVLSSNWSGQVVARLPFEPFGLVQNLSFRDLEGDDKHMSSFMFIYVLCSMCLRPIITKLLGHEEPRVESSATLANTWMDSRKAR